MMTIETKTNKAGKVLYYAVDENGKKKRVKRAEAEIILAAQTKEEVVMENAKQFKGSRWVKIHKQGESNFEVKDNVMDITLGEGRYQAEILYKTAAVKSYKKAAYWLFKSLTNAAKTTGELLEAAQEQVSNQVEIFNSAEQTDFEVSGEQWNCKIEKLDAGAYKASIRWTEN